MTMNNKDTVEAPERIRLVKREGRFANEWYYPDAAIMPFEAEFQYGRVDPPAAPTESRAQSVKELADAALLSLERIDTVKLAAMGRDGDAEAVGNARRLVDRLIYEIIPLCGIENPSSSQACIRHVNHDGPHSPDVGDTWKERNQ